jgi:hypothetical protein
MQNQSKSLNILKDNTMKSIHAVNTVLRPLVSGVEYLIESSYGIHAATWMGDDYHTQAFSACFDAGIIIALEDVKSIWRMA